MKYPKIDYVYRIYNNSGELKSGKHLLELLKNSTLFFTGPNCTITKSLYNV